MEKRVKNGANGGREKEYKGEKDSQKSKVAAPLNTYWNRVFTPHHEDEFVPHQ